MNPQEAVAVAAARAKAMRAAVHAGHAQQWAKLRGGKNSGHSNGMSPLLLLVLKKCRQLISCAAECQHNTLASSFYCFFVGAPLQRESWMTQMPSDQKAVLGGLDDEDFGKARTFSNRAREKVDADWNLTPEQRMAKQRAKHMKDLLGITVVPQAANAEELKKRHKAEVAAMKQRAKARIHSEADARVAA